MLTKEEREAIAERLRERKYIDSDGLYKSIVGKDMPQDTPASEDDRVILDHLIELCDTSNMIELPLDKDGEVIHIGDVVYDSSGMEWEVNDIRLSGNGFSVAISSDCDYDTSQPEGLTHKQPATIELLVSELKKIARSYCVTYIDSEKLYNIAYQLEKLGDSDD